MSLTGKIQVKQNHIFEDIVVSRNEQKPNEMPPQSEEREVREEGEKEGE